MSYEDFESVFRATVEDPIASIFFNRSIDWEDPNFNEIRSIVDLTILTISMILNSTIIVAIFAKRKMHTPISCYIASLTISHFTILLNVLDDVLNYWFAIDFKPDLDLVGRISLQSSSLTLGLFTLDRYLTFCRRNTEWHKMISKLRIAIAGVLIIWGYATITSALELNLYDHFRTRTITNIFCWSTAMYVLLPTFVIVGLIFLVIYEYLQFHDIMSDKWNKEDVEGLRLLVGLAVAFYLTMVPQRIATILYYKEPQICCTALTMNICYYLAKVSTIVNPIICLVTMKNFRTSIMNYIDMNLREAMLNFIPMGGRIYARHHILDQMLPWLRLVCSINGSLIKTLIVTVTERVITVSLLFFVNTRYS